MGIPRQLVLPILGLLAGLCVSIPTFAHDELSADLDHLDSLVMAQPADVALLLRRAELRRLYGDSPAAARDLARVESLAPQQPELFLARAAVAADAGRFAEVVRWVDRYLAVGGAADRTTSARALVLRAHASDRLGHAREAMADYDRAFAIAPAPRADWVLNRARLARVLGDDPLPALERALIALPDEPALVFWAAEFEALAGHVDLAVARLDHLAAHGERDEAILARTGDLLAAAGRRLEAEARWSEALASLDRNPRGGSSAATENLRRRLTSALAAREGSAP